MSVGVASSTDAPADPGHNPRDDRRSELRRFALGNGMLFAVLIALIVGFSIWNSDFFTIDNFRNIGVDAATTLVLAVGETFVLIGGAIDLSIASVLVFGGVVSAKVMAGLGGDSLGVILVGLVVALLSGAAVGIVNGFLVTRARIASLIVTLASLGAVLGAAELVTGGSDLTDIPNGLITNIGFGTILGIPWLVLIAVAVAVVAGVILACTQFGRYCYAVGSNSEAALRAGVPVRSHVMKVFVVSGALAGLAGFLSLAQYSSTTIGGHSTDLLQALTAVVLGGASIYGGSGTMLGTGIGVLIPAVLLDGLVVADLQPFWQQVAVGVVLVIAVYVDGVRRRADSTSVGQQ